MSGQGCHISDLQPVGMGFMTMGLNIGHFTLIIFPEISMDSTRKYDQRLDCIHGKSRRGGEPKWLKFDPAPKRMTSVILIGLILVLDSTN